MIKDRSDRLLIDWRRLGLAQSISLRRVNMTYQFQQCVESWNFASRRHQRSDQGSLQPLLLSVLGVADVDLHIRIAPSGQKNLLIYPRWGNCKKVFSYNTTNGPLSASLPICHLRKLLCLSARGGTLCC